MTKNIPDLKSLKPETRIVAAGREYAEHGIVNPAVYHASTILFPTVQALHDRKQDYLYGRRGTPTSRALETAIAALEGGHACKVSPSGMAAVSTTLLAFLKAGDHLLMVDTAYHPTRQFCDSMLKGLGIETTYYDPLIGRGIAGTYPAQYQDCLLRKPGIADDGGAGCSCNRRRGPSERLPGDFSTTPGLADTTSMPLPMAAMFPFRQPQNISWAIRISMLGSTVCNKETWPQFQQAYETMGQFAGPDDMYLALRGLRTLDVRLERHMRNASKVAEWLRGRDEVETVLYPALSNDAGHQIWKRDFTGASGLFSVVLKATSEQSVAAMLDGLSLFGMGFSWGGFESLVVPFKAHRTATTWTAQGPCLRFHIGLENPDDLIDDLKQGFERLKKSS